jgi:hypothetical protein
MTSLVSAGEHIGYPERYLISSQEDRGHPPRRIGRKSLTPGNSDLSEQGRRSRLGGD